MCLSYTFPFRGSLLKMHVEADKYNSGALVQKYEAGIKGFFKDEDISLTYIIACATDGEPAMVG